MAGPSLMATLGANISGFTRSMEESQKLAQLTGANITKSLGQSPADVNSKWQSLLKAKDQGKSFMAPGALGAWRTAVENAGHEATGKTIGQKLSHGFKEGIGELRGHLNSQLGAIASIGGIEEGMRHAIEYASKVQDLSLRLGLSTDAVQEWDYALKINGSSIEENAIAFQKLGINMSKAVGGNPEMIAHFKDIGLSIDQLKGKASQDVMGDIGKLFEKGGGDSDTMMAGFTGVAGKGAGNMVASFRDGISEIMESYRSAHMGMRQETIETLDKIGDDWDTFATKTRDNVWAPMAAGLSKIFGVVGAVGKELIADLWGPILRIINGFKEFRSDDILGSIARIGNNALEAPDNMKAAWAKEAKEEEEATKRKEELRKKGRAFKEQDVGAEKKKELQHLKELTDEEARRGKLAAMTNQEKYEFLTKEVAMLEEKHKKETDAVEKAKLGLEIQKKKNELADSDRKFEKDLEGDKDKSRHIAAKSSVNSLQQIGGFIGTYVKAPEVVMLDVQKRSEHHLAKISASSEATRTAIQTLIANVSSSGVQF